MTDKQKDAKTEAQAAGDGVLTLIEQLRAELAADKGWDYTEYEKGRITEKERMLSLLAAISTPASHDAQQPMVAPTVGDWPAGMTPEKAIAAQAYIRDWTPDYVKDWIDSLAQQPAVVGDGLPLRVFSAGRWTYDGTGQTFSHEDMDAAAFVVYRDHAALTPAATPKPQFTPSDADRHRCYNCGLHVVDHVPDEEGARCKQNAVETLRSYTRPAAQKEGNGNG